MNNSYIVTASALNLRSEPNAHCEVVTALPHGHIVEKIEEVASPWWKVSTKAHLNSFTGYVSYHYLHLQEENATPVMSHGTVTITKEQILALFPHAKDSILDPILPVINDIFSETGINTNNLRVSAFFAQLAVESNGLRSIVEDLHYSAHRLHVVWPRRFPTDQAAQPYAGNPEKLANHIYCDRLGNGNEASGDGWRFRGRGLFQLTGRYNYGHYGKIIGMDLEGNPDQAADPATALKIAAEFWKAEDLNGLADQADIKKITRCVNGGYIGMSEREAFFRKACAIWK